MSTVNSSAAEPESLTVCTRSPVSTRPLDSVIARSWKVSSTWCSTSRATAPGTGPASNTAATTTYPRRCLRRLLRPLTEPLVQLLAQQLSEPRVDAPGPDQLVVLLRR